jgi:glycosyltransferase involved in cell wall biosynthesis
MNILYVLHKDPDIFLGGIERHTLDLIKVLSLKGIKPYLIFPSTSAIVVRDFGMRVVTEKKYKGHFCNDIDFQNEIVEKSFIEILKDFSIDVVHFQHLLGLPLSLIEVAKRKGKKVIVSLHDYYFWCPSYKLLSPLNNNGLSFCFFEKDHATCARCLNRLGKKRINTDKVRYRREYIDELLSMSDSIIVFSEYVQDIFRSLYNSSSFKTMIIEHGIDVDQGLFPFSQYSTSLNIAYLGAFTYEKGADIFIEIVRKVKSMYFSDEVNFTVIGEIGYPLPSDLLRLEGLTSIGAYRPHEVGKFLRGKGINLVLLLSRWPETYSYTLSEAMAYGIPMITTDLGALRERLAKYSVGYLVHHENPIPRTIKIIEDFIVYPEVLHYFQQRCAIASKTLSNIDEMAMKYIELY